MRRSICIILMIIALVAANAVPVYAQGRGHGGGGHGDRGDWHGRSSFSGSIWIGPGWGGWGPWWGSYPYYPYYPFYYPYYYSEPPIVMEERAPSYAEPAPQAEEEYYWYFCPDSGNYYPYVKQCPSGWLKVVPRQTPPDWRE